MRQYFYKSELLISIYVMVAILFSLCGIAIVHGGQITKVLPVLSDSYVVLYDAQGASISLNEYVKCFEGIEHPFTVGVELSEQGRALYSCDGRVEKLALKSGRVFSKEEYSGGADVMLLRDDMVGLCEEEEDGLYYRYQGVNYKVIGLYEDLERSSLTSAKFIINLYAESLGEQTDWNSGFFDAGEKSMGIISGLESVAKGVLMCYPLDSEKGDVFRSVQNGISMMLIFYAGVAIMVLLNVFAATNNWLKGKRKEIVVRKLVGASQRKIYSWLVGNFMSFVFLSFAIGVGIVKGILIVINEWGISPSMVIVFGNRLEWKGIGIALGVVSTIGLIIIIFTLKRQLRKEIIQVIRSE